jgi:hypothetical protein
MGSAHTPPSFLLRMGRQGPFLSGYGCRLLQADDAMRDSDQRGDDSELVRLSNSVARGTALPSRLSLSRSAPCFTGWASPAPSLMPGSMAGRPFNGTAHRLLTLSTAGRISRLLGQSIRTSPLARISCPGCQPGRWQDIKSWPGMSIGFGQETRNPGRNRGFTPNSPRDSVECRAGNPAAALNIANAEMGVNIKAPIFSLFLATPTRSRRPCPKHANCPRYLSNPKRLL